MATAMTYVGDGKSSEVDWGMMTNLDTNAEYMSIIFVIIIIAIIVIAVPGQLTASKVALFWPAVLRCASRAVHLCGSNGTANG